MMASHVKYQEAPVPKPRRRAGPLPAVVGTPSVVYLLFIKPTMKTTRTKINGHINFPIWVRAFYQNRIYQDNFTSDDPLFGQVDFPRLRLGKLGTVLWSVYSRRTTNTSDEVYHEITHDTVQQIDLVYRRIKEYSDYFLSKHTASQTASVLCMDHALGVRYASPTHTCHNKYADREEPAQPLHGGLSEAGKVVPIQPYEKYARRCPRTTQPESRVIMLTFYPQFLANDSSKASLTRVADHIQYIGEKIRRDVQEADMLDIMGRNFIRVLQAVEDIALSKQHERPLEDGM
ncbi:renal dipeptidase [Nemania sp. FL0031]|nr:renal dipeptidase [Nemania sp. FL0031]